MADYISPPAGGKHRQVSDAFANDDDDDLEHQNSLYNRASTPTAKMDKEQLKFVQFDKYKIEDNEKDDGYYA